MKRHRHSLWIFFNSVQQLDSGRTWQAWQMSLQPMVQLYKRNVSGESGEQNNLHFFMGIPQNHVKVVSFWGGEGELFSCKASNYRGALPDDLGRGGQMSPSVSFWWKCQSHQRQTLRSMGLVGSHIINNMSDNQGKLRHKKLWQLKPSWNEFSASHWSDIYHTAYNCEIFLFPLLIIVATYIRIYTLLSRCPENNFLS